jgi:antitoxin (DNA-binding transcriptional repressor) of toxin-antitoxin stability system
VDASVEVDSVARDLKRVLEQLDIGESVTLVDSRGTPVAVLVSLRSRGAQLADEDWDARWDLLAQQVSEKWQGDASALETLARMRR